MAKCKTAVCPVHQHLRYCSLALSHWYHYIRNCQFRSYASRATWFPPHWPRAGHVMSARYQTCHSEAGITWVRRVTGDWWKHTSEIQCSWRYSLVVLPHCSKNRQKYGQTSNISCTETQNFNVSHLVLQLSLPNLLEPRLRGDAPTTSEWTSLLPIKLPLILEVWGKVAKDHKGYLHKRYFREKWPWWWDYIVSNKTVWPATIRLHVFQL